MKRKFGVNLENTSTKANLVMDRDNLSTIVTNNDVEMRIELGNDRESSAFLPIIGMDN